MSTSIRSSRLATRVGGWSLIAAAIGFMSVFTYLAARFDYPDVLDGQAPKVLPQLLALGESGRAAWAFYACLPLLLIPAGVGAYAALRQAAPNAMLTAIVLAALSAVSMLLGLARWPSIHWELARTYAYAPPEARVAIDATFTGLNLYLGNYIGEFVGELALNGFFVVTGFAALHSTQVRRWFGLTGIAVGVAGWVGAFRNISSLVGPIAELNNYLLPVWLIVLGVVLIRWPATAAD